MSYSIVLSRLIFNIFIFFVVINGWWFIALPLIIFGLWFYPLFIESLLFGVMYDSLFGMTKELGLFGYLGTIVVLILLIIRFILKKMTR